MSSSGTKSTSNDSSTYVFSPSEALRDPDSEVVSSSHKLLKSSPSRTSLPAFPRAWLRTRLVKSALLPLILRPCCFKYISSWLLVSASIVFISPRNISTLFFAFCIQELKVLYITFTRSLIHVVLGTGLLQRPLFRGGQFSLVEQFLYLNTREKFVDLVSSGRCHSEKDFDGPARLLQFVKNLLTLIALLSLKDP